MALAAVSGSQAPASIWKVHAVLVLVQCGFGGAYVVSKVALTTGVKPIVFAVYRDVIAFCAIAPVAYFAERGKRGRHDVTTIAILAILGVIGVFAAQLLLLFGLKLATASLSSVVSITIPVCTFFLSALFGVEDINWRRFDGRAKVGGLINAVVGGVLIAVYKGPTVLGTLSPGLHSVPGSEWQLHQNETSPLNSLDLNIETWQIGVILLFLAGASVAIYITLQVPFLRRYPAPISQSAIAYFFGVISLVITGLLTVQDPSEWILHRHSAIISALYVGVVASGANYALQAWALQKAGPVLVASYIPLQPFVTSFLAVIFLGESLTLGSILGTFFIITGLYFITWGKLEGGKLAALSLAATPTPDGLLPNKAVSDLEEPLLR